MMRKLAFMIDTFSPEMHIFMYFSNICKISHCRALQTSQHGRWATKQMA